MPDVVTRKNQLVDDAVNYNWNELICANMLIKKVIEHVDELERRPLQNASAKCANDYLYQSHTNC